MAEESSRKRKRPVNRRFIDAETGEEVAATTVVTNADDVAREVRVHKVTASGDPGKRRPIAIGLWVGAIVFEVLALLVFNGTLSRLPGKALIWLIAFIVLDLICVVVAGQLWKQANHIDPPSEANKVEFFLKSQLGAILSAVAFVPVIILMLTDQEADGQTKKLGIIAAAIALVIGMGTSIDFHPVSAEDLAEAEENAIALGTGTVYWTEFGHVYHLNPNCQAIINSADIYQGDVQAAFEAGRTRACKFCANESGSDVLKDLAATDDEKADTAAEPDAEADAEETEADEAA
ncbi:MAG: hypothetical protein II128_03765 [Atopobiaceae bacterium]|jgi:hypothetical protein|nr:hypothetical protein [Atopobiaceae bacterium]